MAMLKREDILAAKLKHEVVAVPEWGGEVVVWEMGAAQKIAFQEAYKDASNIERIAHIVGLCLGDEAGVFKPAMTVEEMLARPADGLLRVYEVAVRLNVMSQKAAEEVRGE